VILLREMEPQATPPHLIMPLANGKLWIQNRDGEGMETTQEKVAIYLKGLWNAEF
jgi:hypothetical protein